MLFGEWLVKEGLVTVEQVQRALQLQTVNGGRLGTNLVLRGALEVEALIEALGAWSGFEAATIEQFEASDPAAQALVSADLAVKHKAYPLALRGGAQPELLVALRDPHDTAVVEELARAAGGPVRALIAPEFLILRFIERTYERRVPLEHPTVRPRSPTVEVITPKAGAVLPERVLEDLAQIRQLQGWLAGASSGGRLAVEALAAEEATIELSEILTETLDV